MARMLREPPHLMGNAANHLEAWLSKTMRASPLLDVSFCWGVPSTGVAQPLQLPECVAKTALVMDLEPKVKPVEVSAGSKRQGQKQIAASARAQFVYPLALELEATSGMGWADAVEVAESCWQDKCLELGEANGKFAEAAENGLLDVRGSGDEAEAGADVPASSGGLLVGDEDGELF